MAFSFVLHMALLRWNFILCQKSRAKGAVKDFFGGREGGGFTTSQNRDNWNCVLPTDNWHIMKDSHSGGNKTSPLFWRGRCCSLLKIEIETTIVVSLLPTTGESRRIGTLEVIKAAPLL